MGRIKTFLIKSTAKKLIKEYGSEFSPEFEKNKSIVSKHTNITSAKMRNTIAGYTARLVKQRIKAENSPRKRLHEEDLSKFYQ